MGSVAAGPRASERPEAKNLLWLTAPGRTGFHKEERLRCLRQSTVATP